MIQKMFDVDGAMNECNFIKGCIILAHSVAYICTAQYALTSNHSLHVADVHASRQATQNNRNMTESRLLVCFTISRS